VTRAILTSLSVLWALTACNVASVQEQPNAIPQNQCTTDADCAVGSCADKMCRSNTGGFDTILFEVTPPADGTSIAGVQFLKRKDGLLSLDGTLDLALDPVAQVLGEVTVSSTRNCVPKFVRGDNVLATANDGSIPALISIVPSSGVLGLFSSPLAAQAVIANQSSYRFQVSVPPGQYDIYVQPSQQSDDGCPVPPQLLRNQAINGTVTLNIALPEPQTFALHVTGSPADGALNEWTADMLDPLSGRVISNVVQLALAPHSSTDYVADLSYLPVSGDKVAVDQLIRLSPPIGVIAPTLLLARSGLGLFSASSGTFDQLTSLPSPVHVEGAVTEDAMPLPVAASVMLVATNVAGINPGVLTSFVRTVSVGTDGTFGLDVLPGTYRVSAVPTGVTAPKQTPFAEATTEWVVGSSPSTQAGKVIEMSRALSVNGAAVDPSGNLYMTGAQVQAVASPASIVTDVLHQALGEANYVPRAASATVDSKGEFNLYVDTGTYDFSVRPRASSGFAWLVQPGIPIGSTPATTAGVGFGTLTLPLPVVYRGNLTVPGTTVGSPSSVPGALISAYIYLKGTTYTADPTQADSVLEIAEARSDDTGAFTLLIPASLNAAGE
jgi:hypothetical protein